METQSWYVITGGVSCGKTTLLKNLASLGFLTIPETARVWIEEELTKGSTAAEVRGDEQLFQRELLKRKLAIERQVPRDRIVFFERAVPDSVPYFSLCGLPVEKVLAISKHRYRGVFFCEPLPLKTDLVRIETEEEARLIDQLTRETYESLGYPVVYLPAVSVMERVEIVCEHIQ